MALIKWEPFGDMDRFFEDFASLGMQRMGLDLAVDVYEEKNNVVAKMNLPGVNPEKIEVSVEDNHLFIQGKREEEKEEKKKHYYSKEIRRGSFERVVPLPNTVKKDQVKADYEKGVLTVTIPKASGRKSGKVKVNVRKK